MKKKENPNRVTITTPNGILSWPHLTNIDFGTENFPKPDGEYNVRLILSQTDQKVKEFINRLDELMEVSKKIATEEYAKLPIKARKNIDSNGGIKACSPYGDVFDQETEQPTGEIEFRAKMKAGGIRKKDNKSWSAKPALFDAKGQPLPPETEIWGGSTAILSVDLEPFFVSGTGQYGLLRRLRAAQILKLVSSGANQTAEAYGFEAQDGFDASTLQPGADTVSEDEAEDEDVAANF